MTITQPRSPPSKQSRKNSCCRTLALSNLLLSKLLRKLDVTHSPPLQRIINSNVSPRIKWQRVRCFKPCASASWTWRHSEHSTMRTWQSSAVTRTVSGSSTHISKHQLTKERRVAKSALPFKRRSDQYEAKWRAHFSTTRRVWPRLQPQLPLRSMPPTTRGGGQSRIV